MFGLNCSDINDFMKTINQDGNQRLGEYLTTGKVMPEKPLTSNDSCKPRTSTDAVIEDIDDRQSVESDKEVKEDCAATKLDWNEIRGDYFDLRDWLKLETRLEKVEWAKKKRNDQILLLREHLIMQMCYNDEHRDQMIDEVIDITEIMCEIRESEKENKN